MVNFQKVKLPKVNLIIKHQPKLFDSLCLGWLLGKLTISLIVLRHCSKTAGPNDKVREFS